MKNKYETNRDLVLEFPINGLYVNADFTRKLEVPKGAALILVKDATYCDKLKKRVDRYALDKPELFGADKHEATHRFCFVPDDAVKGRLADATLIRKATKAKSDNWQETADRWLVYIGGQEFDYYTGIGHRDKNGTPKRPLLDDVLHSLVMDSDACEMSFAEWCSNFGYDTDSRKAFSIYEACQINTANLRKAGVNIAAERERLADY